MILGVDPGYRRCGWAVVEDRTGRVRALGVICTEPDDSVDVSTDRARRLGIVSRELRAIAIAWGCTKVAAEQALGHGAAAAVAANQLPWGAVVMLCVALGLELYEVKAKTWQHAVLDIAKGKVDYDQVEAMLADYVGVQLAEALMAIIKEDRTHALDGTGVALLVALRPHLARLIIERSKAA